MEKKEWQIKQFVKTRKQYLVCVIYFVTEDQLELRMFRPSQG